jgi:D-mannonate dehydratase
LAKEDKAKIKMTVIHFETESDNATLQENIRAITQTLIRALASPQRVPTPLYNFHPLTEWTRTQT